MTIKEAISTKLGNFITIFHFDLKDTTGKHIHHDNFDGGYHLNAIIVSDDFKDLELLNRHQLVYKALGSMIKNEIHALSMKTYTVSEWNNNVT
jgi:stress-induced morphogen